MLIEPVRLASISLPSMESDDEICFLRAKISKMSLGTDSDIEIEA